jgi:hypothetical protein
MISAADYLVSCYFDESYGLGVAGFEADGCSGCDVESVAVGFDAVEFELGIGFDEVVMGTNLPPKTSEFISPLSNLASRRKKVERECVPV